ncbi:MAG TPA: helix-turn-helix domain-containing protein [Actinokineospora sp.]|jgi:predicted DNA-binding transcriptional regulator AlpA|nr:helix-turn-helix domain-containing protein [Actinokineospora sp.]
MTTHHEAKLRPLWSVEDVSAFLGVPVKTLYQWKWRGEGPPVRKVGRHLRYDPDAVTAWFNEGTDRAA